MKDVAGNNADTFKKNKNKNTWYQFTKVRARTQLSPEAEKLILSLFLWTLPLWYSPLLHRGLQSRAPGIGWLPGLESSSAWCCCGSARRRAGSEGETKALTGETRQKDIISVWGLRQLRPQRRPGFAAALASWWQPTPRLRQWSRHCIENGFNLLGTQGWISSKGLEDISSMVCYCHIRGLLCSMM